MAVTEQSRHRLHNRLEEIVGDEYAATLMEHLPPVGWADVATKQDLLATEHGLRKDIDHLREVTELRFAKADAELKAAVDGLRAEMHKALGRQTFTVIGATCAIGGLALGVAHWL